MTQQERLRRIAAIVLLLPAVFFGMKLIAYWQESRTAAREFSDLSRTFYEIQARQREAEQQPGEEPGAGAVSEESGAPPRRTFAAMEALTAENGDCHAFLDVAGTGMSYPVMFTPEQPEYYLHRSFRKAYSAAGTPFLDGRFDPGADNYIVYGHNMKNGGMFSDLLRYRDAAYFQEHGEIRFTTLREERRYAVIAAFPSAVHRDRNTFPWFDSLAFADEAEFEEFVRFLEAESLHALPARPVYGDRFITLATCAYHDSTGRFVVIGREVPGEDGDAE